VKRLT
jgi:hypothetical protein